jgi:hypothetical protein
VLEPVLVFAESDDDEVLEAAGSASDPPRTMVGESDGVINVESFTLEI